MDQIVHRPDSCVRETVRIWASVGEPAQPLHELSL